MYGTMDFSKAFYLNIIKAAGTFLTEGEMKRSPCFPYIGHFFIIIIFSVIWERERNAVKKCPDHTIKVELYGSS